MHSLLKERKEESRRTYTSLNIGAGCLATVVSQQFPYILWITKVKNP